jgi:hypothetical protein
MRKEKITGYVFAFIIMIIFCLSPGFIAWQSAAAQEPKKGAEAEPAKDQPWEWEISGWRISDFKPYIKAMQDLQKVSTEYSELLLKQAMDEYATGIDLLEDMENQIIRQREINKNKKNLNEKWYWQEVDRKNQEERQILRIKQEAKMKSISSFVKAIDDLDQISSKDVNEKPELTNFKIRLFQVYVSTQYDLHNFLQCLPILERYIAINDTTRKDLWAYKYMSNCYAFVETMLSKNKRSNPDTVLAYKQKKNKSLLQAAEIQFGIESVEYKHLHEIVEKDEIKNERLNDFR